MSIDLLIHSVFLRYVTVFIIHWFFISLYLNLEYSTGYKFVVWNGGLFVFLWDLLMKVIVAKGVARFEFQTTNPKHHAFTIYIIEIWISKPIHIQLAYGYGIFSYTVTRFTIENTVSVWEKHHHQKFHLNMGGILNLIGSVFCCGDVSFLLKAASIQLNIGELYLHFRYQTKSLVTPNPPTISTPITQWYILATLTIKQSPKV